MPRRLKRLLLVIMSGLLLFNIGLMLPASVMALPMAVATAKQPLVSRSVVGSRSFFANQPIASATAQMPAIVVNRLRQDLSQRTKVPTAQLKLLEAQPKTWNDGCFGLPKPDEICTQSLVEGWRVVFVHASQRWVYRTDKQGQSYRLEE